LHEDAPQSTHRLDVDPLVILFLAMARPHGCRQSILAIDDEDGFADVGVGKSLTTFQRKIDVFANSDTNGCCSVP
jgi:hypothetical protein